MKRILIMAATIAASATMFGSLATAQTKPVAKPATTAKAPASTPPKAGAAMAAHTTVRAKRHHRAKHHVAKTTTTSDQK